MLCYIAYPTSMQLQAANALQTYSTIRELKARRPDTLAIVPQWGRGHSRFHEVGAVHLPRPAVGKLSRLYRSTLWYYLEYSAFAAMCVPIVARHPVRVIYVRQSLSAAWWAALFAPRMGGIPVVYEVHDMESRNPSRAKEQWAQGLLHLLDRTALTRTAAVASLTADFRTYLQQIGWRDPAEVAVIPDGYDDTLFSPRDRAAARAVCDLPPAAPIIAYAGLTFAHRWLDGLLDAFAALHATMPTLQLVLVGGRPHEVAALQQQAHALGVADAVRLLGMLPQQQVVHYLNAADVLVIPDTVTDMTASPLKLFEYLALGQPLVLPALPALREIVPANLGHFFARRDPTALRAALQRAVQVAPDPTNTAARRALAQDYTYGRRAERILTLADAVAARGVL